MSRAICRLCAHVNPDGARFCSECGAALTLVACPECEAINAIDAPRCHQCGTSLATPVQQAQAPMSRRSEAMSVPMPPSSGARLQANSGDRTPIALAERFERVQGSPTGEPDVEPDRDLPTFEVAPAEGAALFSGPAPEDPSGTGERERGERERGFAADPRSATGTRRGRIPLLAVGVVVIGLGVGSYYGWQKATRSNVVTTPGPVEQKSTRDGASDTTSAPHEAGASAAPRANANEPSAPSSTTGAAPAAASSDAAAAETSNAAAQAAPRVPAETAASATPPSRVAAPPSRVAPSPARAETKPARAETPPAHAETPPSSVTAPPSRATSSATSRSSHTRTTTRAPKIDKDALATERLIERDLGRFLPHDPNGGAQ